MPYVPLPSVDRPDLLGLAGERWTRIADARPDLRPAVELQQKLIATVVELADELNGRVPRLSMPPRYVAAKLSRGVPALSTEPFRYTVP